MKHYNINPIEKSFDWGEMAVVSLGERGRGRFESLIPFHADKDSLVEIGLSRSGKPKIVKSSDDNGWLAVVSGDGTYTRGTYGTVYCLKKDKDAVNIISSGFGAYGAAGRTGRWHEYLISVNYPLFLKIRPAGGSHKIPRYWLYFGEEKVHKIKEEELPLFCEQFEIEIPKSNLIDLNNLI